MLVSNHQRLETERTGSAVLRSRFCFRRKNGKKKTKLTLEKKYNLTGWAFLLPAAILIFVFCFYPMAQAILLSFRKTGGVFTGLSNYTRVFQDKTFQQCLFNTFFYFLIQVPIMLVLALILAQLLNSPKIRCKGLFRT